MAFRNEYQNYAKKDSDSLEGDYFVVLFWLKLIHIIKAYKTIRWRTQLRFDFAQ